jgi:dTDP-4-amino-4,6-dideoxygalactose transaminase
MEKILFNEINKSCNNTKNIEFLFSDYELFRKKHFSTECLSILSKIYTASDLFLTHSATGGLEIIATLLNLNDGDEIIMPSFTFVSTAISFVNKGVVPVFVDINPSTLNIDESKIEAAITPKTKAIIGVHYAGHACNLIQLKKICTTHKLALIEDAAMGFGSNYGNIPLGSYGDFGVISFDITKHIQAVQGGLLLINNKDFSKRAHQIYNIGTNRDEYKNGDVPYYEWVDFGSKYQMNELNAVVLFEQLSNSTKLLNFRKKLTQSYYSKFKTLENEGYLKLMPANYVAENVHEFYVIVANEDQRNRLQKYLANKNIEAFFHYIPLHISKMGMEKGRNFDMKITSKTSNCLLRLPFHEGVTEANVSYIFNNVTDFFTKK